MTQRLTITPEAQGILDDRATGSFSTNSSTVSPLPAATKWAARVHGSVYVHPYVFGSSRGDLPKTYPGNRDTTAKEHGASLVRVKADDYSVRDYLRFPIAGVAGEYWGNFDTLNYARGKLYVWGYTKDASTTDAEGYKSALIEVDPTALTWTIKYRSTVWLLGNGAVADATHFYVSSATRSNPSNNRWHGLVKIDLDTGVAATQGYYLTMGAWGTGPQNQVTYFQNAHFHSLVEDGDYLYGCFPGEEINNEPGYTVKIRKSDLVMMWATQCPQATDDMAQNATHVFGGVETAWNVTDYYSRVGKDVGAFAVRKSDGAYTELPKLGPEDVWTNDVNTNVVSFSSLVRGGFLIDVKFPSNRVYVIDTTNVDSWSKSSNVSSIVLADAAFNMTAVENLRTYLFDGWDPIASNKTGPNEFVVGADGKLHSFCWAYPYPSIIGGNVTAHEGVSSLIRYSIPGYAFADPPSVQTLSAQSVNLDARTATLRGDVTAIGGSPLTEMGFYYGTSSPPQTKVTTTVQSGGGVFTGSMGPVTAALYYVQAFAKNVLGETRGSVVQVDLRAVAPVVATITPGVDESANTATLYGNVSSGSGSTLVERGFYFGTANPPTTKIVVPGTAVGAFSAAVDALADGQTYYVQAFGTNSVGESKGTISSFNVDPVPGKLSGTVHHNFGTIQGVTVHLWRWDTKAYVGASITDAGGKYSFTGLTSGVQYLIVCYDIVAGDAFAAPAKVRTAP